MHSEQNTDQFELFSEYLKSIAPISDIALSELLSLFRPTSLRKKDHFAKEGYVANEIGFLTKGIVRAYFTNEEGKEYNKQFFTGPSIIGAYTSLISKEKNLVGQQALIDCEVLVADYSEINKLFGKHHDLERLGRKIAEHYFMEKEKKEIEMALLEAIERYKIMKESFPKIELYVSQYHIASYLGISPTQLSRIRRKKG